MSDLGGNADPLMQAAARLETAVERLADALGQALSNLPAAETDPDTVPRAAVTALAERLDSTIARLRGALAEELHRAEDE